MGSIKKTLHKYKLNIPTKHLSNALVIPETQYKANLIKLPNPERLVIHNPYLTKKRKKSNKKTRGKRLPRRWYQFYIFELNKFSIRCSLFHADPRLPVPSLLPFPPYIQSSCQCLKCISSIPPFATAIASISTYANE